VKDTNDITKNTQDTVKQKGQNYLQKLKDENPEKLKEYRRTAYLNNKLQ